MSGKRKTSASTAMTVAGDRTVPTEHVGPLEPNYYCRAWNGKPGRMKYCKAVAGAGTEHPGQGRCKHHGGLQQNESALKHGQHLKINTPRLAELIAQHESSADPLNVLPQLARAKALLDWSIERFDQQLAVAQKPDGGEAPDSEPLIKAVDTISKVIYRVEQVRAHGTISIDRIRLFLIALDREMELALSDHPQLRQRLRERVNAIRV